MPACWGAGPSHGSDSAPNQSASQVAQHLFGMVRRLNLRIGLSDDAIRPNQVTDAAGFARIDVGRGTIGHRYLKRLITKQIKRESLLLMEALVLRRRIVADPQYDGIALFKLLDSITESLAFLSSSPG